MNRLKMLREEKNLLQSDIANIIGTTPQAVGLYENSKRDIPTNILVKLADYFGVSTDYLLGKEKSNIDDNKKYYMCPVYGKISAGIPNWAEECIEGRIPIDYELMNILNPEEYFFLKVNGESMNKIIRNGAYALIHKQDYVENGEIAVILVNGYDATLKKFSKQEDIIVLTPESSEDSFKQQIYTKETPIKVIGKYVGKMEFNN